MAENWWDADEVVDHGKKADPQRAFELARATVEDIDSLKPRVNPGTAGMLGAMQAPNEKRLLFKEGMAGTPGYDLYSDILSVQGRNMIDQLMQMKQASPNGASGLGGLNESEGQALKAIIGNLSVRQSPDQLKKNLTRARELTGRLVPGVTQDNPEDLSEGQTRTSLPKGAFYKDPWGNIRKNMNGDKGNPKVFDATKPIAKQVQDKLKVKSLYSKYSLEQ
jgi:hypothetical protein